MLCLAVLIISCIDFKLVFPFLEVCSEVPRTTKMSGSEDLSSDLQLLCIQTSTMLLALLSLIKTSCAIFCYRLRQ